MIRAQMPMPSTNDNKLSTKNYLLITYYSIECLLLATNLESQILNLKFQIST